MEIKPTSPRLYGFLILFDMHTRYLGRALDGISETDAQTRLDTQANHMAWLAGSLVQQRFEMAKELGSKEIPRANELFKEGKGIQDGVVYPSLGEIKQDWDRISPILRDLYMSATESQLDQPFEMPGMSFPLFDMVSFTIFREASIIGQLALWRRLLGYPGMRYE